MNPELVWRNLWFYSLQVGMMVAAAGAVPWLLRIRVPRARLLFWQAVLAAALLLPAVQPWRRTQVQVSSPPPPLAAGPFVRVAPAPSAWTPAEAALALLALGAALRAGWVGLGLLRLRRYRNRAHPLDCASAGVADLCTALAPEADLRLSAEVTGPVTFGARRPVVLLPESFPRLPYRLQYSIACHELLHVARRDWLYALAEEAVRALFWFHPAVWWLLGQIQLSREQTVDREVLEMTLAPQEYLDALLAIARGRPGLDLAPAPLFLRRRHLKKRVVSIFEEAKMSKKRMVPTLAAAAFALLAAGWLSMAVFPLHASPQVVMDAEGVTVDTGDAMILHRAPVEYPAPARQKGVQGTVALEATLDSDGNVTDARVIAGPEELRRAALQSVLQWHFAKGSGARPVTIAFRAPEGPPSAPGAAVGAAPVKKGAVLRMGGIPPVGAEPSTVARIDIRGLTDSATDELRARLPVKVGGALTRDAMRQIEEIAAGFDEHLSVGFVTPPGSKETYIMLSAGSPLPQAAAMEPPALPPPTPGVQRIRVGGNVQQTKLTSRPVPVYPPLAKQAKIQGVVKLQVLIDKDGHVSNIAVIGGHPLLVPAAMEAVRQWTYATTLLNGNSVEVATVVDVNFTLLE